jgi:ribosome-associated protein
MTTSQVRQQTRILVQTAAAVCEDKKGLDTRILELDPVDSALSDFFLITSATNDRQAMAIADEIELQLKHKFGVYPNSVEGRRKGDWILLDYVDFVVHVFLADRRAFYDIERLRKSARPLTPAEFDAELKAELAKKTLAVRSRAIGKTKTAAAAKPKKAVKKAPVAIKAAPAAKLKKAAKKVPAAAKATPAKKVATKKTPLKKTVAKKAPAIESVAKKAPVKKVPVKKATAKNGVAKKAVTKKAKK